MGGKAKREMLEVAGVKSWFAMARAVSLETGHDDKNLQKLYDTAAVIRRTLALLAYTESLETELEGARQKSSQTDETLRRVSEGLGALLPKDFQ